MPSLFNVIVVLLTSMRYHCHAELSPNDYLRKEFSLIKPFSGARIPLWDILGNTMITPDYVRLTPDEPSRSGAIWGKVPCNVRDWEIHLRFRVHGKAKSLFGDGFAFWYARDRMFSGPVFGSRDYFHGLAVFFDTYSNHNGPHNHGHPYISAMVNNGTFHYDHDRDGTHTEMSGCQSSFRNRKSDVKAIIRYVKGQLTVSTDIDDRGKPKECFTSPDVRLPIGYHFGLSAATGELSDNHDIISFKFYDIDMPGRIAAKEEELRNIKPEARFFQPPRDHIDDAPVSTLGGFRMFLLVLIGLAGTVLCVGVSVMVLKKRQERNLKRFY